MLKKKVKLLTIILALILILSSFTSVFADEPSPISVDENTESIDDPIEKIISNNVQTNQGDRFINDKNVTIDYVVDGNLYVIADTVTIKSEIQGDAFILAKEVNVENEGYVFNNLFVVANKVNISGVVYDLYAVASNVTMNGYTYRDMKVFSNDTVSIIGTVGRDAYIAGTTNINFQDPNNQSANKGIVSGNLNYYASKTIEFPQEAIGGNINYTLMTPTTQNIGNNNPFMNHLYRLGCSLALIVIVWLVTLWLAPKFAENNNKVFEKKPLAVILLGILSIVALPVIGILLIIPRITIPAALVVLAIFALLLTIGTSLGTIVLNNILCEKSKVRQNGGKFIQLLILGAILYVIELIPYVGAIISVALLIIGIGIVFAYLTGNRRTTSKPVTKATVAK